MYIGYNIFFVEIFFNTDVFPALPIHFAEFTFRLSTILESNLISALLLFWFLQDKNELVHNVRDIGKGIPIGSKA